MLYPTMPSDGAVQESVIPPSPALAARPVGTDTPPTSATAVTSLDDSLATSSRVA